MKFWFVSMIGVIFSAISTQAGEALPISRLEGLFTYQEQFDVPEIRRTELVPQQKSPEGKARIKALRREGYTCISKNPEVMRCFKSTRPQVPPEGLREYLARFMSGVEVEFHVTDSVPELGHDGSTTQEWFVRDPVRIRASKVGFYRITRTHEGHLFLSFPVSEEQPLGLLTYHSAQKLGLKVIINSRESELVTYGYVSEVFLQK